MTPAIETTRPPLLSERAVGWARDLWTILLLVSPIYGCFFPAESYVSLPSNEGKTGYQSLPFPITTIEVILMGVTCVLYFWMAWRRGGFRNMPAAYVVVVIALASAAWAGDPSMTILRALRFIPLMLFAISLPQLYGVRRCMYLMTIAFLISALLSIFVSLAFPALGVGRIGGPYDAAWRGAMIQKNLTGAIFAVGIYVSILAWMLGSARFLLASLTAVLCLLVLLLSQSGTAVVALCGGLAATAILMVVQRCPPKTRLLLLFGSLLALIGFGLLGAMVADMLFSAAGRDMTFTGRTPIWAATWQLIQIHPLRGYGYAFWTGESQARQNIWTQLGIETGHSHNTWLDIWLQLGVVGLIAVIFIMWRSFASAMKLAMIHDDPLGPIFFGLMLLLLIRSMTEVQFTDPFPSMIFFPIWSIICTEMLNARYPKASGAPRIASPPFRRRYATQLKAFSDV
jgi:exopolysaccharide production protein ExoQ